MGRSGLKRKKRKNFVKIMEILSCCCFKASRSQKKAKLFSLLVKGEEREIATYLNMSVVIPSSENSTAGGEYRSLTPHNSAPLKSLSSRPPNRM